MKTKLKIMMALLVAICITGISTVNAATEFSDKDKNMIVTLEEDLGVEGTVETRFGTGIGQYYSHVGLNVSIKNVDQTLLNEFASKERSYKAEVKVKFEDKISVEKYDEDLEERVTTEVKIEDIDKVTVEWYDEDLEEWVTTEAKIKEIDGQKYIVYSDDLNYHNFTAGYGPSQYNNDVSYISIASERSIFVKYIKKDGSELESYFGNTICVYSEQQVDEAFYDWGIENEYGISYTWRRYSGTNIGWFIDKHYQLTDMGTSFHLSIPATANLKEYFYNFYTDVYQGENIEVENVGTLKYAGIERGRYVYKNSLDNLRATDADDEEAKVKMKSESGYEYPIRLSTWQLSESEEEWRYEAYTQTTNTAEINNNITVSVSGKSDSEAGIEVDEIPATDALYKRLLDGLAKAIDTDKYASSNVIAFDLHEVPRMGSQNV